MSGRRRCLRGLANGALPVEPEHLPGFDVPGWRQAIGITQLPIVATITPGNAVQGFPGFHNMTTPIHRGVVKVVAIDRVGVAAG